MRNAWALVTLPLVVACVGDATPTPTPDAAVPDSSGVDAAVDASDASPDSGPTPDGSAGDAGDSGSAWSPTVLGNTVVLWLDGDSNVTLSAGKVGAWGDKSTAGNTAVQGTAVNQPIVSPVTVNGHKAVRFPLCTLLTIPDNLTLQFGTGGFTLAGVFSFKNTSVAGDIFVKQKAALPYEGVFLTVIPGGNFASYVASSSSSVVSTQGNLNTGAMHRVVLRYIGQTSLDIRVDGVAATVTVASTDVSAPGVPVKIGAATPSQECFDGDIAELVLAKKALSGSETTDLEGYFKTKYGL